MMLGAISFDADACARDLVQNDQDVAREIREAFGSSVFDGSEISRSRLRQLVFSEVVSRRRLEGILHSRIRQRWLALLAEARASGETGWLLLEIPLLFETRAEESFDRTVVVAASTGVQMRRMMESRNLDAVVARQMIDAQWPMEEKVRLASHVLWNDGALEQFEEQTRLFAYLISR